MNHMMRHFSLVSKLETRSHLQYVLLGVITLIALILRLYRLGEWSFWIDELAYANRAQVHYNSLETTIRNLPTTVWLPLSLLLTGGVLNSLGIGEWSTRLVPSIVGVISIPLLYFPIKGLFKPSVALVAALLLAVSPWHLYWSQNARYYTALMLLYTLAMFAFFYGLERDRPWYFVLFLFLFYLAVSERMFALFLVPVVGCYLLFLKILPFEKPPGLRARNLILLLLPGIAIGIIEVYKFVVTGLSPLTSTINTFIGRPIDSPIRILTLIVFNVGVPLLSLALFAGIYLLLQKSRTGLFFLIGALVPPLLLAALNPFFFTVDRYVFVTLPSWIILGAIAVKEMYCRVQGHGKILAAGVLFLLLADAAGSHLMYYQINHGNRPDWRGAFAYIQERRVDGDVIVSAVANVGTYYTGEEVTWLGDIDVDTITRGNKRYWFVIDSENGWWSGKEKRWVEEHSELVEAWYLRTRENMHLRVYLFDPERSSNRAETGQRVCECFVQQ